MTIYFKTTPHGFSFIEMAIGNTNSPNFFLKKILGQFFWRGQRNKQQKQTNKKDNQTNKNKSHKPF
jgi:hypothetical protein